MSSTRINYMLICVLMLLDSIRTATACVDQYVSYHAVVSAVSEHSFYFAFAVDEGINKFTFTHTCAYTHTHTHTHTHTSDAGEILSNQT